MHDFNNRNNIDFQRDPLDSKNINGVHWQEMNRKLGSPPLLSESKYEQQSKGSKSINSVEFIVYFFIAFLGLMAVMAGIEFIFEFF